MTDLREYSAALHLLRRWKLLNMFSKKTRRMASKRLPKCSLNVCRQIVIFVMVLDRDSRHIPDATRARITVSCSQSQRSKFHYLCSLFAQRFFICLIWCKTSPIGSNRTHVRSSIGVNELNREAVRTLTFQNIFFFFLPSLWLNLLLNLSCPTCSPILFRSCREVCF